MIGLGSSRDVGDSGDGSLTGGYGVSWGFALVTEDIADGIEHNLAVECRGLVEFVLVHGLEAVLAQFTAFESRTLSSVSIGGSRMRPRGLLTNSTVGSVQEPKSRAPEGGVAAADDAAGAGVSTATGVAVSVALASPAVTVTVVAAGHDPVEAGVATDVGAAESTCATGDCAAGAGAT